MTSYYTYEGHPPAPIPTVRPFRIRQKLINRPCRPITQKQQAEGGSGQNFSVAQDHSLKPSFLPAAIVHVTFECICLTPQKLAFWIHMDITDRYGSKHGVAWIFRSGVTPPGTQRAFDKQEK